MSDVIYLTQGDDSNALNERIMINLNTERDLTGYTAVFQLEEFRQEWDDISSKKLELIVPRSVTKKLTVGQHKGGLKIYDKKGLAKTVINNIKFYVSREVVENARD